MFVDREMINTGPVCIIIHLLVCVKGHIGFICGDILGDDEFGLQNRCLKFVLIYSFLRYDFYDLR